MKKEDFTKGQLVYLYVIGGSNEYRRLKSRNETDVPIDKRIIPTTVVNIGKRFITVDYANLKFDMTDDFKEYSNYSKDYELFLDKEYIYNKNKSDNLFNCIKHYFSNTYKNVFTVEQLEQVVNILNLTDD